MVWCRVAFTVPQFCKEWAEYYVVSPFLGLIRKDYWTAE